MNLMRRQVTILRIIAPVNMMFRTTPYVHDGVPTGDCPRNTRRVTGCPASGTARVPGRRPRQARAIFVAGAATNQTWSRSTETREFRPASSRCGWRSGRLHLGGSERARDKHPRVGLREPHWSPAIIGQRVGGRTKRSLASGAFGELQARDRRALPLTVARVESARLAC